MKRWMIYGVLLICSGAQAQPLTEHVPSDALIYVGWAGIDELSETYEQSRLKAVLDVTELASLFNDLIPALIEQNAGDDPDAQQAVALMRLMGPVVWHRPWAFYFSGITFDEDDQAMPNLALICRAGEHEAAVMAQFEKLRDTMLEENPDLPVRVAKVGDVVGWFVGSTGDGMLTGNASYRTAIESVNADGALMVYADIEGLLGLMDEAIAREEGEEDLEQWHAVRDALGLGGLKQLIYSAGFEGTSWRSEMFVHAPSPRTGLLAALEGQPIVDGELKIVPQTATWVQVSQLNMQGVYEAILDAVASVDEEAVAEWQVNLGAAGAQVGVDLEALIGQFGHKWIMYNDPGVAGPMGLGICIVNRPTDADALAQQLSALEGWANAQLDETEEMPFRFKQIESGRMTIHSFSMPFVSPSWAVHNGNLYITLFPQAITMADIYAQQGGGSLLNNPKFAQVRQRLGTNGQPTSLMFVDLQQTASSSYQSYMMLTQTLMAMVPAEVSAKMPGMLLPPLGLILPHLEPAGAVAWMDEQGYHSRSVSPFPGSSLLSQNAMMFGGGGVTMTATGVGILLPALGAARRTARDVQSQSNLRQLTLAVHLYLNDYDDQFPSSMVDLLPYINNNPSVFVHPREDGPNSQTFDSWTDEERQTWLETSASYIYIPYDGSFEEMENLNIMILFIERPHLESNGTLAVAFVDGHAERKEVDQLKDMILKQTGKTLDELIAESEQVE